MMLTRGLDNSASPFPKPRRDWTVVYRRYMNNAKLLTPSRSYNQSTLPCA
jgi:hypothetical protein